MNPTLRHSVVTSLRWSVAAKVVGQVLSWAMTLIVVRLLTPSDYGLMAMANVLIGLFAMVAELGIGASLVQARSLDVGRVRKVLGAAVLVSVGVALALVLVAPEVAAFYAESRLTAIVQVSALQLPAAVLGLVPDAALRREVRFKEIAIASVLGGLAGTGVTLILAYARQGVWSLIIGALVTLVLRGVLLQLYVRQPVWPTFRVRGIRDLLSFGSHMTLIRVLWYVFSQADILIAGKILGGQLVGTYAVAVHLATLPMQRITSIANDVAFPAFARIQHDPRAISINLRHSIRLLSTLAFPLLWGAASVAPELVKVGLGANWVSMTVPLQIIAAVIPIRMVNSIVATAFVGIGAARASLILSLASTAFAIIAYYVGAQYGILGLSVSWILITPVTTYMNWCRALPQLAVSFRDVFAAMWVPILSAAAMVAALVGSRKVLVEQGDLTRLALLIAVGMASYSLALLALDRRTAYELIALLIPGLGKRPLPADEGRMGGAGTAKRR